MVLYEQQTDNLDEVIFELIHDGRATKEIKAITPQAICAAMNQLPVLEVSSYRVDNRSRNIVINKNPSLKELRKTNNKLKSQRNLIIKKQNRINMWRVENANKVKR